MLNTPHTVRGIGHERRTTAAEAPEQVKFSQMRDDVQNMLTDSTTPTEQL
jgi:hypothetical protein